MCLVRTSGWYFGMLWFVCFLGISVVLQVTVNSLPSEAMSVAFLIATSVVRGQGLSGSEERMIPKQKKREGATYSAQLLGNMQSRA